MNICSREASAREKHDNLSVPCAPRPPRVPCLTNPRSGRTLFVKTRRRLACQSVPVPPTCHGLSTFLLRTLRLTRPLYSVTFPLLQTQVFYMRYHMNDALRSAARYNSIMDPPRTVFQTKTSLLIKCLWPRHPACLPHSVRKRNTYPNRAYV